MATIQDTGDALEYACAPFKPGYPMKQRLAKHPARNNGEDGDGPDSEGDACGQ